MLYTGSLCVGRQWDNEMVCMLNTESFCVGR